MPPIRGTATPPVAADAGASVGAPPATGIRPRLKSWITAGVIAVVAVVAVPVAHSAQPPGDAAAELAASGGLDAALTLLDGWLAEHPGDARLFPAVLQVVTAAPERRTVDAVLRRYGDSLAQKQVGVLRAVPADWAELRGGVGQALDALRGSRLPDAARRQAVLLLELGQIGNETTPQAVPIAVHAGLARAGQGLDDTTLEAALREAFGAQGPADGGADGAVAGYGLVTLLSAVGRSSEAVAVLAELGRRYPRSPEYALAAAELRSPTPGGTVASVVALPSPAMLFGSAALVCPKPCTIPAAMLPEPPAPVPETATKAPQAAPKRAEPKAPVPPARRPGDGEQAGQGARPRTPSAAQDEPPPDRIELLPVQVPVEVGETEPPAAAVDRSGDSGASPAAASRPAPPDRPDDPPPRRGGGSTSATASAAAAMLAAKQAADRLPKIAPDPVTPVTAGGQLSTAQSGPRDGAPGSEQTRVAAAPGSRGNDIRREQTSAAGDLIRVTAQPANRPSLASNRVFVATESRTGEVVRPQPSRATAAAAGDAAGRNSAVATTRAGSSRPASVRVASLPDPAAFIVQVGAYADPDNALEMELKLRNAGFPAVARSYRSDDGSIVHRVDIGGNVTRVKGERVLARLLEAGFSSYISRRDVVSYLPPEPRRR